ncbi:MAG TPA: hypothetical protein DCL80_09920, partial [Balneola sp.]|nr:hypothetical protein [Balneola sp.]
ETDIGPEGQAYTFTEGRWVNNQTGQIAEDSVQRELSAAPRRGVGAADPVGQQGFESKFRNLVNRMTVTGGEGAKSKYMQMAIDYLNYFARDPNRQANMQDVRDNAYLEVDAQGEERSVYIGEDGTRVELSERIGDEGGGSPSLSDTLTILPGLLALDAKSGGNIKKKLESFLTEVARYNKNFEGDPRGDLKVVIDLGGDGKKGTRRSRRLGATGAFATYDGVENVISINASVLTSDMEVDWAETARHELTHQKFWSLFWSLISKNKDIPFTTAENREILRGEVVNAINEFGFRSFGLFRKQIRSFAKKYWNEQVLVDGEYKKGGANNIVTKLGLQEFDENLARKVASAQSYDDVVSLLIKAASDARNVTARRDKAGVPYEEATHVSPISFVLIHELLAYEGMTIDLLREAGQVPTPSQRSFIQKFMMLLKKTLNEFLGID